jgi:hypothetical protein
VPSYEPQSVVVYQREPVFGYYPYAYPLYYYPYPVGYAFSSPFYWGVTTAFIIGWHTHSVHVYGNNYFGHPYYGRRYYDPFYVRRTLSIDVTRNRYANNVWRPSERWGARPRYRAENRHDGGYRSAYSGTQRTVQSARPPRVSNTLTTRDNASTTRTRIDTAPSGNTTRRSVTAGSAPRVSERQPVNTFAPSRPASGQNGTRPVYPDRANTATSRVVRTPSNVYTRPAERTARPVQPPATPRTSTPAHGLVSSGAQNRTAIARAPAAAASAVTERQSNRAAPAVTQRQSSRATTAPTTRFAPQAPAPANPPARTRSSGSSSHSSSRTASAGRSNAGGSSERSSGNRPRR